MVLKFAYFEKPGRENTDAALMIAKENADISGITNIIVASSTGETAFKAARIFDPDKYNLVIVTHNYGFSDSTPQEFDPKIREDLVKRGVKISTGTLAYSGVESALQKQFQAWDFVALFSRLMRTILSEGVKVCHEIVLMAADTGCIPIGMDVISVAGTGSGSDSVCLIKSATSRKFYNARIKAILAKPL